MPTYYCNLGGSLQDTLHVDSLPTVGGHNFQARNAGDLAVIIERTGAKYVMFAFAWMPRRAVRVSNPTLERHMAQVFNPPKYRPLAARPVTTGADDSDLVGIIDNG